MIRLVDLDNPANSYEGRIFWDMLRPGVRLAVLGPQGCMTSVIHKVIPQSEGQYYLKTRNSRYVLTTGREPTTEELAVPPVELEAAEA